MLSKLAATLSKLTVTLTVVEKLVASAVVDLEALEDLAGGLLASGIVSVVKPHPSGRIEMGLHRSTQIATARHLRAKKINEMCGFGGVIGGCS
jgi:hypothetical protein